MDRDALWWKGQLAADVNQTLRLKELKLPAYRAQSPQISLRRFFADLLAILSNRFKLCPTARHLAVYLLDLFMDRYDISVKQLYIVSLSCLVLASKFEEKEDRVPKLEQLNALGFMSHMNLRLGKQELRQMELLLLDSFQWNLCLPTPAHFIDYYLCSAVNETDLHNGWPLPGLAKSRFYMEKYTHYFLEVSLQDHAYLRFYPSQVAAACIAASRICLNLTPSWPSHLQRLTSYTWDHLTPCIELMLLAHENDTKEATKQSPLHHHHHHHSPQPHRSQELAFQPSNVAQSPQISLPLIPQPAQISHPALLHESPQMEHSQQRSQQHAHHHLHHHPHHRHSLQLMQGVHLHESPQLGSSGHLPHPAQQAQTFGQTQMYGHSAVAAVASSSTTTSSSSSTSSSSASSSSSSSLLSSSHMLPGHLSLAAACTPATQAYPLSALQGAAHILPAQAPMTLEVSMVADSTKPFLSGPYNMSFKMYGHCGGIPTACFER
uniref:Cyclin-J-like protein n=1 Tax=Petromyzon marinus TaxID=7757 RepID=A0AAJ7T049_PETMA|nr:cyclin-J-like isoform X2 [Petromyzon marinus]